MRRSFFILPIALIMTLPAQANDAAKIAVVKQAYEYSRRVNNNNNVHGVYSGEILRRYGTASLKQYINIEDNGEFGGVSCRLVVLGGVDLMYRASDPDYNAKASFRLNSRGQVVASVYSPMYRSTDLITYAVKLENGKYKIDDVYHNGYSYKASVRANCM